MDGLLVFEKCLNQPVFCSLPFPPAAIFNDHQRIDSLLSRPLHNVSRTASPLLSQRARIPLNNNDQPAQACTTDSVCTGVVLLERKAKREVADFGANKVWERRLKTKAGQGFGRKTGGSAIPFQGA